MKGVAILKNEKNNRKILQIDVKEIAKQPNEFEYLMDILIAEDRKDERELDWEEVKKQLHKKGKL